MPETSPGQSPAFDVPSETFEDHVVLRPPNRLKERATRFVDPKARDADVVLRAEHALGLLANEFDDWMTAECDALEAAREAAALTPDVTTMAGVYRVAHDIRGQAATLGFPLVGEIAEGLCELFERTGDRPPPQSIVDRHVEAIRAMVREQVRERDHPLGAALVKRLTQMRDQLAPPLAAS